MITPEEAFENVDPGRRKQPPRVMPDSGQEPNPEPEHELEDAAPAIKPCYLTAAEVAEYLKVSRNTVYKMIQGGDIPAVKIGRLIRVSMNDLDSTLRKNFRFPVR